jgi:hypothetical protein
VRSTLDHVLDAGAVLPASVEQDDLTGSQQVRDAAWVVSLATRALGWRRSCDDACSVRAEVFQ